MTLIVSSVVVIGLLVAVLAIFLFVIGLLLNRIADNLEDCLRSMGPVVGHVAAIGPGIKRINETGTTLLGAMPLLLEGTENVAIAKSAPYSGDYSDPPVVASTAARPAATPAASSQRVGYQDGGSSGLGYMDA